ncbi:hypothetical protein L7F22_024374 [Adiantum nelumboides]|nr:hypothetical protein [Adiantum nelumboides]
MVQAMLITASHLATYDHVKEDILHHHWLHNGLLLHVSASSTAGITSSLSSNVMDVVKTQLMNMHAEEAVEGYIMTWHHMHTFEMSSYLRSDRLNLCSRSLNLRGRGVSSVKAPIKSYPLGEVRLVLGLVWIPTKWLVIPVFALSTISELLYTLSIGKNIFIRLGILSGVLLATVIGNACLDVMKELPHDPKTTWPLKLLGLFFLLLKLAGPYYLSWATAFILHMANAGLVKTALLFRDVPQCSVSS